jgi:intergrase/recombinase
MNGGNRIKYHILRLRFKRKNKVHCIERFAHNNLSEIALVYNRTETGTKTDKALKL